MKRQINWANVLNLFFVPGFLVMTVLCFKPATDKPAPGPGPSPVPIHVKATGTHVVVLLDDSAPSIPLTRTLDDPVMWGLREKGTLSIGYDKANREWFETHNFDPAVAKAGGFPAMLVLDSTKQSGNDIYVGRVPTDLKVRDQIFEKTLANRPAPIPAEPPLAVKNHGDVMMVRTDEKGRQFIDHNGTARLLGCKPDVQKFGAMRGYASSNPTFAESEWYDLSRRDVFGPSWIFDQGQHNSCVGNGGVGSLELAEWFQGMSRVKLSPASLYSPINGGEDEGASIPAIVPALTHGGACRYELWGQDPVFLKALPKSKQQQVIQDALNYTLDDQGSYRCDNFKECVSAILAGYALTFDVQVGIEGTKTCHFNKFDTNGIAGVDPGQGNHCVRADGVRKINGKWYLDMVNSWGDWGPWQGTPQTGRVYVGEQHLYSNNHRAQAIAFRAVTRNPKDPNDPPAYKPASKAAEPEVALAP